MSLNLEIVFIILCFLISLLTIYLKRNSPMYLKIFPVFLFITIVEEEVASYLASQGKPNLIIYDFYSVLAFCFYFFVFYQIILNARMKKFLIFLMICFPLISLWNIIYFQGFNSFITMTFSLGSLLVVGISIFYFIEMFQRPKAINPLKEPGFWICTALVFFYTCLFPYFALVNFMIQVPEVMVKYYTTILTISNVFMYSLFSIAFLCQLRIRNSM